MSEPCEWLIRKGGYYYRPNRSGYTTRKIEAGRYTKAEADREASVEPWHMSAIHQDEVPDEPAVVDLSETIASLQAEVERLTLALDSATEMQNIAVAHAVETELAKLREGGEPVAWLYDWTDDDGVTQTDASTESIKSVNFKPVHNVRPLYLHPTTEQTAARSGVRVRELEWWVANSGDIIADSIVGRYRLGKVAANANFRLETPDGLIEKPSPEYYWPEAEAKAAAQADYERRILSALSPAAPEGQQEAACHPLEVYADSYAQMARDGDGRVDCRSVEVDIRQNMIPATQALSRPTERAVTEAMVDRALACFKKHPRTPEQFGRFRETIRSALAAALSTSASTQGD